MSKADARDWLTTAVAGNGTVLLIYLQPETLDRQLCDRLIDEPGPTRWKVILPNDKPPGPCAVSRRTEIVLKNPCARTEAQ